MHAAVQYDREILALKDDRLEQFVRAWALKKKAYVEVQTLKGSGDRGRDVVGYLSKDRDAGAWHNFQCKQYGSTVPVDKGILEVGKVLYYSFLKEFTPPTKFIFVAPRGVNRTLQRLISKPKEFKKTLIDDWDKFCSQKIVNKKTIPLSDELKKFIENYDFSAINWIGIEGMLIDEACKEVMYEWFGVDPGAPPKGIVPLEVQNTELVYVSELLGAYGERESKSFSSFKDMTSYPNHTEHFHVQRERYFDADAFGRFFRDNVYTNEIEKLKSDVKHGVYEVYSAEYKDALERINEVMRQAGQIAPTGMLAKHCGTSVRQGICHHFVNDGKMKWKK